MKLINQNAEIWQQGNTLEDMWKHIARCTRVCYQTEKKNNEESDEEFCKRTILKNEPLNSPKNHLAMLEHGTVYLKAVEWDCNPLRHYIKNEYSRYYQIHLDTEHCQSDTSYKYAYYVTTNLRVLVENNWLNDLKYLCAPTEHHVKRVTISCITNIGVSREFNRHRVHSIAEESTRYCNYSLDKFDNEITCIMPVWWNEASDNGKMHYLDALNTCEYEYFNLIENGWKPQQAREVLPLATKTQLIHTAFVDDWKHFLALRLDGISGAPHPNMKELAKLIKDELVKYEYL